MGLHYATYSRSRQWHSVSHPRLAQAGFRSQTVSIQIGYRSRGAYDITGSLPIANHSQPIARRAEAPVGG